MGARASRRGRSIERTSPGSRSESRQHGRTSCPVSSGRRRTGADARASLMARRLAGSARPVRGRPSTRRRDPRRRLQLAAESRRARARLAGLQRFASKTPFGRLPSIPSPEDGIGFQSKPPNRAARERGAPLVRGSATDPLPWRLAAAVFSRAGASSRVRVRAGSSCLPGGPRSDSKRALPLRGRRSSRLGIRGRRPRQAGGSRSDPWPLAGIQSVPHARSRRVRSETLAPSRRRRRGLRSGSRRAGPGQTLLCPFRARAPGANGARETSDSLRRSVDAQGSVSEGSRRGPLGGSRPLQVRDRRRRPGDGDAAGRRDLALRAAPAYAAPPSLDRRAGACGSGAIDPDLLGSHWNHPVSAFGQVAVSICAGAGSWAHRTALPSTFWISGW